MEEKLPKGIKWTKQRKRVYEILSQAREPISAASIYTKIGEGDGFALSTIYRVLNTFEKEGLVSRSSFAGEGNDSYLLNKGEHVHYAICLECHKKIALSKCPFAHLHLEQEAGDEFSITSHRLELYGYCRDCKQKK